MDYSQYKRYDFSKKSAIHLKYGENNRSYPAHWHGHGEILLIGPGASNVYTVKQKEYHLTEGDILLIWPTEVHAVVDADLAKALIVQYSLPLISAVFDLQRIVHYFRELHVLCITSHPALVTELRTTLNAMAESFFSDAPDRELRCCMLLFQFMMTLDLHREEFADDFGAEERASYPEDIMGRMLTVTDYIRNHLTAEDLSQGAMADMAGISKDYFSRIFKNVTGQNYSRWLNMIRTEKAVTLLSHRDMSLTEIAMTAGFQSISSFNRVFREQKGLSPSDYRKLYNYSINS